MIFDDIKRLYEEVSSAPSRKAGIAVYAAANLTSLSRKERESLDCAIADILNELPGDNNE
jgi:hypothetical protein